MSFDPLSAAFDLGKTAIEKIWPDPTKRAQELRLLEELHQKGDLAQLNAHVQLMQGQLSINKVEAAHPNIFVSGWRPGVGWVCVSALAYTYILYPFMLWGWAIADNGISPPPPVDVAGLYPLLLGMLGIGAMRSHDKRQGVDTKRSAK
jgi:hypothetical protein